MLGHVAKKQRVDRVQETRKDGYLNGIKVRPHWAPFSLASVPALYQVV